MKKLVYLISKKISLEKHKQLFKFYQALSLIIHKQGIPKTFIKCGRLMISHGFYGLKEYFRKEYHHKNNYNIDLYCYTNNNTTLSSHHESEKILHTLNGIYAFKKNFSICEKRGYVFYAPDYVSLSAGIKCLYMLCHDLNQKGYTSCITFSKKTAIDLVAPIVSIKTAKCLVKLGFIAVYPETIEGNPLNAKKVARWVLNRPGLLGGSKVYDPTELIFYYSDIYLSYIKNDISGKLYLPTIDESIFYSHEENTNRGLSCYYVGKSKFKDGFFDKNEVFEITRESPHKKELGKLFRASNVLYTFDNSTILTYEAIMCGCPVVIIPDGTQTREDYIKSELGFHGIAWGVEEYKNAKADVYELQRQLKKVKEEYKCQLINFIKITQNID